MSIVHLNALLAALLAGTSFAGSVLGAGAAGEPVAGSPVAESKDRPHVSLGIISEHSALVPGSTETLGLTFKIEPHWHIYYNGAPGGGNPPSIDESSLPKGFELGEIQWPAPKRYVAPGGIYDSVYEDQVTLLVPLRVPANAKPGDKAKLKLKMTWLECSDVCVFGRGESAIELPIATAGAKPERAAGANAIEQTRQNFPKPLPTDGSVKAELNDGVLVVHAPGAERLEFYPGPTCSDIEGMPDATLSKSDELKIKFEVPNKERSKADGILGVWLKAGSPEAGGVREAAKPVYFRISAGTNAGPDGH